MANDSPRRDVHQDVTTKIINTIEAGAGAWSMPWHAHKAGMPANATTGAEYRGVNVLSLWVGGLAGGFSTNLWASYRQWAEKGHQVRKGEKGTMIVYYGTSTVRDPAEGGDDAERKFRFLKYSHVFNAAQVEGFQAPEVERPNLAQRIAAAESFVDKTGAAIQYGMERAFYAPSRDLIAMPDFDRFVDTATATATENAYSTLLHELTHWTGHEKRCARDLKGRFGNDAYAAEELVAELGAAFLCARLGITPEPRADHAQYLAGWLTIMRADKKAIFTAAAKASAAVDYLESLHAPRLAAAA